MLICPKCKNEYRDGITKCSDCDCDLILEEKLQESIPLIFGKEVEMNRLKEYLEYNGLKNMSLTYMEEDDVYELSILQEDKQKASQLAHVYLQQEQLKAIRENPEIMEEVKETAKKIPSVYQNNADRAA